jgi:predicted secreted hydrolase
MSLIKLAPLWVTLLCAGLLAVGLTQPSPQAPKPLRVASPVANKPKPASAPATPAEQDPLKDSPYQLALPGYVYRFPTDHAAHPGFKTEWWYYTGHLWQADKPKPLPTDPDFGFELTFFRSETGLKALPSAKATPWRVPELYAAHFTITDHAKKGFTVAEALGRPHPALAEAKANTYQITLGDWGVETLPNGEHRLTARSKEWQLSLTLASAKPPAVHGHEGVSQKAACTGCASHYYSLSRLVGSGTLTHASGKVIPLRGQAWMDHEFGSNQLTKAQVGWDWFSLQLANNEELMLYVLRLADGTLEPYSSGSLIDAQGKVTHLPLEAFTITPTQQWTSPTTKGKYPMAWQVSIPSLDTKLTITPTQPNQELVLEDNTGVSYWEGACRVAGLHRGAPTTGLGYVELTGYAKAFNQPI